ncbi:hypothetical protein [Caballeronia insecticola]|uniref:Uncharacterized protein n=1 Tax=Caballeronia insecticola TaxID=758793 RepID=R4WN09_9BURK|nr:hypothetical protein [Caballeronia insecticola]BAN25919.1 hypothetical protein BRPE64_BCDS12580 [Caballeronia insecticola]
MAKQESILREAMLQGAARVYRDEKYLKETNGDFIFLLLIFYALPSARIART